MKLSTAVSSAFLGRATPLAGALALTFFTGISATASAAYNPLVELAKTLPATALSNTLLASPSEGPAYYTIVFKEAPLATYAGGVSGLPAPSMLFRNGVPSGKLDVRSPEALAYVSYLQGKQEVFIGQLGNALGRPLDVMARMQHGLNAVIVRLSNAEASDVMKRTDVDFIEREHLLQLDTDRGPSFIGAPSIWGGTTATGVATKGEGILIGDIDTGINWQSPGFAGVGPVDGYVHVNPKGSGNYLGQCLTGAVDEGKCNSKLIGIYNFATPGTTGEDVEGHGSHTASTVAGNTWNATYASGPFTVSGVAPHANIVAYKACLPAGCSSTATAQSANQAIADGVDVINYSISGGTSPWTDATSTAFRNGVAAGLFVAASAGNTSTTVPNPIGQVNHMEPWVETVAASTEDRIIAVTLDLVSEASPPPNTQDVPMRTGGLPLPTSNLINVPMIKSPNFANGSTDGCSAYPANTFVRTGPPVDRIFYDGFDGTAAPDITRGGVAVLHLDGTASSCGSGARRTAALNAGAVGVIFVDVVYLNLGAADTSWSMLMSDWLNLEAGSTPATAAVDIDIAASSYPSQGDVMAAFSFRGPRTVSGQGMVKPDITGPGVDILAVGSANLVGSDGVYLSNGTSMSSPHMAGAAALMRALNPTWSPTQIKSALNLSSNNFGVVNVDNSPASLWDYGSGRVNLTTASQVGLIMDETSANFLAANPATGGNISSLNLASMAKTNFVGDTVFTRTFRRARSGSQTYTLSSSGFPAGAVEFSPASFNINSSGTQTITVTAHSGLLPSSQWTLGELTLTPSGGGEPNLHLPIALNPAGPAITVNPGSLSGSSDTTVSNDLTISNIGNPTLNWTVQSSGTAQVTPLNTATSTNGQLGGLYNGTMEGDYWSQNFDLSGATHITTMRALGFVLPSGSLTTTNTPQVTFSIYADNSGVPAGAPEGFGAAPIWTYSNTIGSSNGITTTSGTLQLNLNAAPVPALDLPSGRYWMTVYPTINGDGSGSSTANPLWAWRTSPDAQIGNPPVVYEPYYDPGTFFTVPGLTAMTAFVQGTINCTLPSWASLTTSSGSLGFAGSQTIPVVFDATGLSAGTYTATLCIASNATNLAVAPVGLTFTVPNGGATPPTLSKAFAPTSVETGVTSTLTITLTNSGPAVSTLSASLTDTFPAGLVVAATPNEATTCTSGVVTAAAGSGSVSLASGAEIPASGSCTVNVDVQAATANAYANTIAAGALQTDTGNNASAANASLTVTAPVFDAPTIGLAFAPTTVTAGTPSTLTMTLANTNATIGTLTADLIDYLPAGLQVAPTPNASTTCAGGAVTAVAGASTFSLSSGAQIPATGSCTVAVDIRGVSVGMPSNVVAVGDLQTTIGSNTSSANAALDITAGAFPAPYCARAFSSTVEPITLVNIGSINNITTELTGSANSPALEDFTGLSTVVRPGQSYPITFKGNTDGFYADPFRIYVDWNQDGVFAENETEYSGGGTIFGSSGIDAVVTGGQLVVPISAKPGATRMRVIKVNSTGPTACTSTASASFGQGEDYTLIVDYSLPTVAQRFTPGNILPGGTSTLSVTLVNQNTAAASVLSGGFINPLPAGLVVAATPNSSTTCPSGSVSATAGAGTFSLSSGAQIPRGGSCVVQVDVSAAGAGGYVKTVADDALQTSTGNNASTAPAQLNVDTPPADTTRLFANNATDAGAALLAGPTTTVSTTRYTPLVCGRVTLSQPGEQLITSFSTTLFNNSATAITSSTTTAITFWDDTGPSGGPGIRLSAVNGLYPGYSNGYFGYGVSIPAGGTFTLNAAPFGYRAIRVPAPAAGGRARVWTCVHFSSGSVTDAVLSNLGVEKFVNSPTFGSTEDLAFVSTAGGPTTMDNPAGALVSNSGGTENVFGWQLFTAGQAPVLDTVEGANAAGVAASITQGTTGQTGVSKNFQGYAANLPVAGDKTSLSGTANWSINGAIISPICTVVGNYTGIKANLKFWGTFNGTGATDVFGSPIATRTVDIGSFNCTSVPVILNGVPVRFSTPVVVPGASQLGVTVQFSSDTGSGFTENGDFTSAVSTPASGSTPAVGTNASVNGWYRSFTNRADLNFTGTTANDYVSTTRAGINIRLYGERVQ